MGRTREPGWLRPLAGVAAPALRVVCFPHSGGSASAFAGWADVLPPGVQLVAVQYPGRSDRFVEPLVGDVAAMAGQVAAELLQLPRARDVLFGHSLGAVVAYETALVMRDVGQEPHRLCVSACLPPGHMENSDVHDAPDDEFWATLVDLGGIEPDIADNAELRELLLPALRSDLRAHATYLPWPGTRPLTCPVSCYYGSDDPLVGEERLAGWAAVTTGRFTSHDRPGGHFHLADGVAGLVADVVGGNAV